MSGHHHPNFFRLFMVTWGGRFGCKKQHLIFTLLIHFTSSEDLYTYASLLSAFVRAGRWHQCLHLLQLMRSQDVGTSVLRRRGLAPGLVLVSEESVEHTWLEHGSGVRRAKLVRSHEKPSHPHHPPSISVARSRSSSSSPENPSLELGVVSSCTSGYRRGGRQTS